MGNLADKAQRLRFLQRTLALVGSPNNPETSNLRSCSICYEDNLDALRQRAAVFSVLLRALITLKL